MPSNLPPNLSYAEALRFAMKTAQNPHNRPLSIRDLEKLIGVTYEHIRKCVRGEPVVSAKLNEALCKHLGLDTAEMWKIAQREKAKRKFKQLATDPLIDVDVRLSAIWSDLRADEREVLCRIAEGFGPTSRDEKSGSETECFLVTLQGQVLVIAASEDAAASRALDKRLGARVVSVIRVSGAEVLGTT